MVIILGQILCVGKYFTWHKAQCEGIFLSFRTKGQWLFSFQGTIIQNCISENLHMALWLLLVLVLLFTEQFRELFEVEAMTFKLLISQYFLLLLLRHKCWWNFTSDKLTWWSLRMEIQIDLGPLYCCLLTFRLGVALLFLLE